MIERQRPQSKVSLEDLLRLKRAERPESEFWARFEDQLRRKQLAAIVDKRPWWRRLSAASIARISIPVGAAAVVVFTLVTVAERKQPAPETVSIPAASLGSSPLASVSNKDAIHSTAAEASDSLVVSAHQADAPVRANVSDVPALASASVSSHSSPETSDGIVVIRTAPEPSLAQVILGLVETTEIGDARPQYQRGEVPLLASMNIWNGAHTEDRSSLESSSATTVSSPRDDRRARLLASVDSQDHGDLVSGNPRVAKSRDRIANRLAEQSLYDSISRLGLNGDSVSIKF
jgi:hypothetical protein